MEIQSGNEKETHDVRGLYEQYRGKIAVVKDEIQGLLRQIEEVEGEFREDDGIDSDVVSKEKMGALK